MFRSKENEASRMKYILMGLLCLLSYEAKAQINGDSIGEVIVTGNMPPRDVTVSSPTRTFYKEDMELLGLHDLTDVVKKLAGVSVKDYGGIGGLKTVSIRNLGAQYTTVIYDDVCISNTQAGQIDLGRYSLDNVEEVSLTIGQDDNLMRSARHDVSAGVLSIMTERPHLTGKSYALRIGLQAGSFGLLKPSLRYWQKIGRKTLLSLDGTFTRADGAYPFTLVNGTLHTKEKRYNSDVRSWKGEANIYHTFNDSSQLNAKAYYYYSERGLPGVVILYSNNNQERLWDENFFAQATYHKRFNQHWQLKGRLKYNHSWNRYEDTNMKYADGKITDIARQNEYYASATSGWQPTKTLSFSLAQDIAYNTLNSNIESQPNPERFTSLTSFTARLQTKRWQINGNLLATYITEHTDMGREPADRKRLSPSFSASFRLLNNETLFLRAMTKSTFRVPTFTDMYYLHIGNSNLVPEKAVEYNLGLTWHKNLAKNTSFHITIDGYYNHVRDKIVCFPTTYVWKMTNFGKVRITGMDATAAIQLPIGKYLNTELTAAYSLQNAIDLSDKNKPTYHSQIPYTPKYSGNGSITIRTPWINIGYHINFCGERWSDPQNFDEYRLKPYADHNLTLSHQFNIRTTKLLLSFSIQNLTNEQYEIIQYYPMPGRNITASATWEL